MEASMNPQVTFDSIESGQEFLALFAEIIVETKRDIEADLQREKNLNGSRRFEALEIIASSLETLEDHMKKSRRILNDLRSLRRVLCGERADKAVDARPES